MHARVMPPQPSPFHQIVELHSEAETEALGRRIAGLLRVGDTVTLAGSLGAGKTVLARGLIRHFLPDDEVPSPTFTLVQTYEAKALAILHVDLYRVKSSTELRELGLDEALERGAIVVEWPDRMGALLPKDRLDIIFEGDDEGHERTVKIIARGGFAGRIGDLTAGPRP
jgi:tRNA threonylcarbamoyladenosine biosynthesis protein TsaE